MRFVSLLLLLALLPPIAARQNRTWVAGVFGSVSRQDWGHVATGLHGACDPLRDVPTNFDNMVPIGGLKGTDAPPGYLLTSTPTPHPIVQAIRVDGPDAIYLLKYQSFQGLSIPPHSAVDYAVDGKHVLLRMAGEVYKTDIVSVTKHPHADKR